MNKNQRDRFYNTVAYKEFRLNQYDKNNKIMNLGEFCRGCGKMVTKNQKDATSDIPIGVLDCIPNDGDHSNIDKLQLLCKQCNAIKNPKTPKLENRQTMTFSEQKNEKGKRKFRPFAYKLLNDNGGCFDYDDLVASGAEWCDLETVTIERYMKRLLSSFGPFMIQANMVYWKPDNELNKWVRRLDIDTPLYDD